MSERRGILPAPGARGAEVISLMKWAMGSWLKPAGAEAKWQQEAGHRAAMGGPGQVGGNYSDQPVGPRQGAPAAR